MIKLVVGWVLLMILIVVAVRIYSPADQKPGNSRSWREKEIKGTSGDVTVSLVNSLRIG